MKTTNTIFLAFLLSACLFITLAQEEEEPWYADAGWGYDPNYIPDVQLPDSGVGYELTCDNVDKVWWTLQKLVRCRDPYLISSQDIEYPWDLAWHINNICSDIQFSSGKQKLQFSNQAPFGVQYINFVETSSITTDAQDSIAEKVGRKSHHNHNQQTVFAQTGQSEINGLNFPNYPEGVYAYSGDGDELHSMEECVESFVENPHYRGPVNYTDIERLVAIHLLLVTNLRWGNFDQVKRSSDYCNDVMRPLWEKWSHFPGDGVETNIPALLWFYARANEWHQANLDILGACWTPTFYGSGRENIEPAYYWGS